MQAAAEHAQRELARIPNAAKLETPPSWAEQQKHVLTHPPILLGAAAAYAFVQEATAMKGLD